MPATLEDLERRLVALEQEVAELRLQSTIEAAMTSAERGVLARRAAIANQPAITASWKKALEEMGITGEPTMTAIELRAQLAARGVDPNANEASREILAMREE